MDEQQTLGTEADLYERARVLAAQHHRPLLVGVDGPGGAGKSTLARALSTQLTENSVVVEGDDFYSDIDWDERAGFSPGEAYARNYDWQRLRDQVLLPARNAASALRYQRYEWDNRQIGQWIEISMPEAVIVEGVYTLRPELREFFDLKVFVKASQNTRLDRMRARHQQYTEEIRSLHDAQIERWVAAENYYATGFEPQEHADIVISGESL